MYEAAFQDAAAALAYLDDVGGRQDVDIDIFEAALALALQEHPGKSVDQYRQHLNKLEDTGQTHLAYAMKEHDLPDGLEAQLMALRHTMNRVNGYAGDPLHYDDVQNADLIRVIDRRLGMPITIGIIALALGRRLGWPLHGLNFPSHFLLRLDGARGQRVILDPFNLFAEVEAHQMRKLLKAKLGAAAELSAAYYEPATNREILLRLQNNIKHRMIEAEEYTKALACVTLMKRFAPQEYRLLFDEGVLLARLDQPAAAVKALRAYIDQTPSGQDRMQALSLINELNAMLN